MSLEIRLKRLHRFDVKGRGGETLWPDGHACLNTFDSVMWTLAHNDKKSSFVIGLKKEGEPVIYNVPFKGQVIYNDGSRVVIGSEYEDITAVLHLRNGEIDMHTGSLVDACLFDRRVYAVANPFTNKTPTKLDSDGYVILNQGNIPFKGIPLYIASDRGMCSSELYLLTVIHSDKDMKRYKRIGKEGKKVTVTGNAVDDARYFLEKDTEYQIYKVELTNKGGMYPVRGKKVFSGKASRICGFDVQEGIAYIADGFELKAARLDTGEPISLGINREEHPFNRSLGGNGSASWLAEGLCVEKIDGRTILGIVTGCSVELYGVSSAGFRN